MPTYRNVRTGKLHRTRQPSALLERSTRFELADDEPEQSPPLVDAPQDTPAEGGAEEPTPPDGDGPSAEPLAEDDPPRPAARAAKRARTTRETSKDKE